ncbi:probable G-protein coupled receptor 158 [Mytilus californianus]|uniref:probable G-protein coupled receptor 158 n=1 Tax=Mytilus californianus TaxID=6549 RepID=UPI002245CAA9|nr:probable G-protein coupled receptor 158 [Mytilus californianus]
MGDTYSIVFISSIVSFAVSVVSNYTVDTQLSVSIVNISQMPGHSITDSENIDHSDVVTKFLELVEQYEQNKYNCTTGTNFTLGDGVIKQYGKKRFKAQALVAVNRANFLTRIWKDADQNILSSENFFFSAVRSMLEGDPELFAAGNCYDKQEFKNYRLFCPYSHRTEDGRLNVKDLSVEYDYLGNDSEWFYSARVKASKLENFNYTIGYIQPRYNQSHHDERIIDRVISVTYEHGHWSKPYFDCGGGNIWMMTYTVPFFGYKNGSFKFKGTSGIDIDLQKVDIDQCPNIPGNTERNVFAGSAKCKQGTTKCVPIEGLGFRRGSYKCVCKDGYYFPDIFANPRYYNGSEIEAEFAKKERGELTRYDTFVCEPCAVGCDTCEDGSPCILSLDWLTRSLLLGISCIVMCCIPLLIWFSVQYRDVKVMKAASPVLLRLIVLGAFFLYCPLITGYFEASVLTCILRCWFREIGFSISYGALLLKTWRISVVFRVRSAQRVKISDTDLIKRLLLIIFVFAAFLTARTIAGPPQVVEGKHYNELKAFQCSADWWDHSAAIAELLFLIWGIRLCIVVRKAPSEFNESRFISWAIYNETLLSLFLNVSMIFLQHPFPSNPDLVYLVIFIHTQLTTTVTLAFLFGSKAYHIYRRGKNDENSHTTMISKGGSKKSKSPNNTYNTNLLNNSNNISYSDKVDDAECESLLEKDIQEEFRRLYTQLEYLKQRNMKIGNRHLQHKLSAMTEAAQKDTPNSVPASPAINGKRVIINLDIFKESTDL